ncbi:hypothetical protein Dfulv_37785 [Dactylosporangium fulvum]|uniref:Uncharacterized protein n=1 Tax=Dactylosporangium fulvum TaxID=53359 RepID=A0ABY5VTF5_9ACTN|nr:hypothetical protein [Dactylosporangium fulvum]UWP80845.1 hypothetical protein Dfulv_37785 [Dactylosporangium fulvum]
MLAGVDLPGRLAIVTGGYEPRFSTNHPGPRPARCSTNSSSHAARLHPGSIVTDLARFLSPDELRTMGVPDDAGEPILDPARGMKTPEQGAATQVWCATSPQLAGLGGVYCENVDMAPLSSEAGSAATTHGVMPYAVDSEAAAHLWDASERLVSGCRPTPRTRTFRTSRCIDVGTCSTLLMIPKTCGTHGSTESSGS